MSSITPEQRFWSKVDRSGGPDACWNWIGYINKHGYGSVKWRGKCCLAHRTAYEIANGPIPEGKCVLHKCDNPPCCNPAHLFAGTKQENAQDAISKGRFVFITSDVSRGKRRLTYADYANIVRQFNSNAMTKAELATLYGVATSHISYILSKYH